MSYIGAEPTTAAFPFDQFSGNGTTTAFTLTYAPASTTSIIVAISGVVQNPNLYSVIGTTITFSPAPPTGTNNISVLYLGLPVIGVSSPGNTAYFSSTSFTATGGQTTFTPSGSYQVGFINVIRNGSQLAPADYTATNGTTVTLLNPCVAGDIVVIEVFTLTSISNALPLTGGTVTGATTFNTDVTVNGGLASGYTGFKNRIINGGMVIDQRNAGASVSNSAGVNTYFVDRWNMFGASASKMTGQRSTTAPAGFINSALITSSAATTPGAGDAYGVRQIVEGLNIADLGWGTANAQAVTLSFWVRSSITGTYAISLFNADGSSPFRTYVATYSISAANTFEYKTITIPGDTSGTWLTTNGQGIQCWWDLGSGSNFNATAGAWNSSLLVRTSGSANWIGTNGATFYITGVQLERGSNATSFEFRDYGRELQMCQRYYQLNTASNGYATTTTGGTMAINGAVVQRSAPTLAVVSGTGALIDYGTALRNLTSFGSASSSTSNGTVLDFNCSATTGSKAIGLFANSVSLSAEL
jgi:hypothetical protein